jgi:dihydropteroate synthase
VSALRLESLGSKALAEALAERGYPAAQADATADGVRSVVLVLDALTEPTRETLLREAAPRGIACVTGRDWAMLAGGVSALAGLVRPDTATLPAEIVVPIASALAEPPAEWSMARGRVSLDRPCVAGIVNVTPDSFSDGGRYLDPAAALGHAEALVTEGADVLDVGAESTRPGRPTPVGVEEEWRRLEPVLTGLAVRMPHVPVSVDTVHAETARRALAAGAWAINDVSGLRLEPDLAAVCAEYGAGLVLMHSRGDVTDMATYDHARYGHVAGAVAAELRAGVRLAEERGVARERIVLDPGLGFAKKPEHNLALLRDLGTIAGLGAPVMVGPSRKRFLGVVTGREVQDRDEATAAACVVAYLAGAALFRVHAVGPAREALALAHAVRSA